MARKSLFSVFLIAALLVPSLTQAASSYTYSLTSQTATKYVFDAGSLAISSDSGVVSAATEESWYDGAWGYRQKLIIDQNKVAGELENFPIVVVIDDRNNDLFAKARQDGRDILFTLGDGTTKLSHELEQFTADEYTFVAWVKLPTLTNREDTPLWLYYGNPSASEQQDIAAVWDNSFAMVQHLNEKSANGVAGHKDSTRNKNDGTPQNFGRSGAGSTTDAEGKIGGANRFQGPAFGVAGGDRSYVQVADTTSLDITSAITLSAWVQGTNNACCRRIIAKGSDFLEGYQIMTTTSGRMRTELQGPNAAVVSNASVSDGNWHHVMLTYDREAIKWYIDGVLDISTAATAALTANSTDVYIGVRGDLQDYWDGPLDEVRISNVARSAAWVTTEYNNQNSPETFFKSVGSSTTDEAVVTPLANQALSFYKIHSFIPKVSGTRTVTYQLSNNGGTTWYYFDTAAFAWRVVEDGAQSTAVANFKGYLSTFPRGPGKFIWRAILPNTGDETAQLSSVTILYDKEPPITLDHPVIQAINELFQKVFARLPTRSEWTYWADRVITKQRKTTAELLDAMQWHKDRQTAAGAVAVVGSNKPTVEVRNGTNRQGLAKTVGQRVTAGGYPILKPINAKDFRRENSKVYVINHGAFKEGEELAATLSIPSGLDLPAGERATQADLLVILGYDFGD